MINKIIKFWNGLLGKKSCENKPCTCNRGNVSCQCPTPEKEHAKSNN